METEIARCTLKALQYKPGTKDEDPDAIGRLTLEFDAELGDAAEIAAMLGQWVSVTLSTPQQRMTLVDRATGEVL